MPRATFVLGVARRRRQLRHRHRGRDRFFPISSVYDGLLWWPANAAAEALDSWRELIQSTVPDESTTDAGLMRFPPTDDVPAPLRGRSFVVIYVIHLGSSAEADAPRQPLRALNPVTDTMQMMPAQALRHLHMDPDTRCRVSATGSTAATLLSSRAIDGGHQRLPAALPTVRRCWRSSRAISAARCAWHATESAAPWKLIEADYAVYAVGAAPTVTTATAARAGVTAVMSASSGWAAPHTYLEPGGSSRDRSLLLGPQPAHAPAPPHQGGGGSAQPGPLEPPDPACGRATHSSKVLPS